MRVLIVEDEPAGAEQRIADAEAEAAAVHFAVVAGVAAKETLEDARLQFGRESCSGIDDEQLLLCGY